MPVVSRFRRALFWTRDMRRLYGYGNGEGMTAYLVRLHRRGELLNAVYRLRPQPKSVARWANDAERDGEVDIAELLRCTALALLVSA